MIARRFPQVHENTSLFLLVVSAHYLHLYSVLYQLKWTIVIKGSLSLISLILRTGTG